ncbi:hypothetical protein HN385_05585 [archaeon]|jgi:uncharacterized membrane protein (UPF0127 family)|nr:hypothetical protein [archaeon]MBT3450551.1 hypothetical protein [archaeon]MBT6868523.1 hypothetical protein [archaeon]MBT7193057.1 hypothetical protein [archaeon]MBT7381146.1 hypothetical protein [archaeon]
MIFNKTKQVVISKKEKLANNLFSQGLGLMFSRRSNLSMSFNNTRKISLHNCFVFYSLEILVLDKDKKVLEIKRKFKPFSLHWRSKGRGNYLIELGVESSKGKCEIGDVLDF